MYLIDHPSAAPALPAPAAAGAVGYFSGGNPVAGQEATVLTADFLNMLMIEIVNVVLASGQQVSKTNYTQLRDAIGMAGSLGGSGYLKLPLGLILQWGVTPVIANGQSSGGATVIFPIAFPSAILAVTGSPDGQANPSWGTLIAQFLGPTATQMVVHWDSTDGNQVINTGPSIRWIAIGK